MCTCSHEIMTPLNCILGAAQLLRIRDEASPLPVDEEFSSLVSIIEDSGQLLSTALGGILNFSTVSQREISLDLRPVDVRSLVEDVLGSCRKYIEAKDLLATHNITISHAVLLDSQRMEQVLVNLLTNACKFNRDGGDVHVAAEVTGADLLISVKDSGLGMSDTVADQISETNFFYQGDSSRTKRFGGIGLGLAITCKLVKAMGGSLDIDSTEGQGSLFTICVPLNPKKRPTSSHGGKGSSSSVNGNDDNNSESDNAVADAGCGFSESTETSASGDLTRRSSSDQSTIDLSDMQEILKLDELKKRLPCVENVVCLVDIEHEGLASQVRNTIEQNNGVVLTGDSSDVQLAEVLITTSKQAIRNRSGPYALLPIIYLARPSKRLMQTLLPIDCSQVDVTPLKSVDLLQAIVERIVPTSKLASSDAWDLGVSDVGHSRQSSRDLGTPVDSTAGSRASSARRPSVGSISQRSSKRNSIDNSRLMPAMMRSSFYKSSIGTTRNDKPSASCADLLVRARSPSVTWSDVADDNDPTESVRTKILVAEDNEINIKICSKILVHVCGEQTRIDVVRDGRQALEALERNPSYNLVLMDIHMPDMDGIEASRELRKRGVTCPIVALSADSTVQDECLRAGMHAFLRKPLKVTDIKHVLTALKIDV